MWISDALQDLRFAVRMLAKRPGFAGAAVATLALGIGATTAVFSVVDAVLLRPLPYKDSGRLVAIFDKGNSPNLAAIFASYSDFDTFREHAQSFESVSAATWAGRVRLGRVLTGRGPARSVLAVPATSSFFDTLGVPAALGRTFHASDENSGCAVVLAHSFWTDKLGADPSIFGHSLTLDHKPCAVLGVMPASFAFYPHQAEMWMLLGPDFDVPRAQLPVGTFARLKPGVTLAQAQAEASALHRALHQADGKERDLDADVRPLQDEFTFLAGRTLRTTLLVVFGAVGMVLLIACLNLSNLLLGRLAERHQELAVRAALGSGRGRLVRQVLTEGLLFSLAGSAAGVALAEAAVRYFNATNPIEITVGAQVRVNLPVMLFSGVLAIAATLLFGMLPALQVSRVDLVEKLRAAGRGSIHNALGRTGARFGGAKIMIAAEMGVSLLLLAAAALLLASALRMGSANLGFDPHGVLQGRISLPAPQYSDPAKRNRFFDDLLDRVNALHGVRQAALGSSLPPYIGGGGQLEIRGRKTPDHASYDTGEASVSLAYFDVLKTPVLRGRRFDARDRGDAEPVAIVNQALVDKYFPDGDAIGGQVRVAQAQMPWLTVVGVVANLKHTELMNEMKWVESPALFRPLAQDPPASAAIAVRLRGDAPPVAREIQDAIAAGDDGVPLGEMTPLEANVGTILQYPRFRAAVLGLFALSALLLSAVGLHGVLAQIVARRTAEFGLRRAVGARTRHLLALVARQGGIPVLMGLAGGLAGSLALGRVLAGLLYGVQSLDLRLIGLASLTLLAVAAIAIAVPAWRAARVDPMTALRDQ